MSNVMNAKGYAPKSIVNYLREMRYLFAHFHDQHPRDLVHKDLVGYLNFVKREHGVGRDKCRLFAAAASFFYKHIFRTPLVFASELYPRKEFRLPEILSQEQVIHLLESIKNPKHKLVIGLFYGTGMRLGELCGLKMECIDRKNFQIKIEGGKGNKDRFTLLPKHLLPEMEAYYRHYRPKIYLFEGHKLGLPHNERSIQDAVRKAMKDSGLERFGFSSHSLRHSFATHLLDQGNDIHTIKELLGHSKIETTMIYLHLQQKKRAALCSPLDFLLNTNE
ncbi:tyrosine-type recombinase/integrase [Flavobacterium laiguense]|uniref:tyrosine-type recombinase/integrase n=1 Tax=Flavobacterium laiguense TaxID=2169409 RepID=UPI001CB942AF|nr:tyrosine-type recombinase/integrase [Flavobacterium laiguense]